MMMKKMMKMTRSVVEFSFDFKKNYKKVEVEIIPALICFSLFKNKNLENIMALI